jgi:hypothetical protein
MELLPPFLGFISGGSDSSKGVGFFKLAAEDCKGLPSSTAFVCQA